MTPHVRREIDRQPAAWERAAASVADLAGRWPERGERIAVVGCGTSWFMAEAYARLREDAGQGETDCFAASEMPAGRSYDRLVAITRSGTTTEVVRLVEATRAPTVVVTAVDGSPAAVAAEEAVVLGYADEVSVVQTLFATTTLMLLRASLGEDLTGPIEQARAVLAGVHPLPVAVTTAEQFTFLGRGWAYGVAREAALKLREAASLWTESYPQMEYRHGPIAIASAGRATWIFGPPVPGIEADGLVTGAAVVASSLDPVADLVRAQLLAVARAEAAGLDPDRPRHLTRSVILPG